MDPHRRQVGVWLGRNPPVAEEPAEAAGDKAHEARLVPVSFTCCQLEDRRPRGWLLPVRASELARATLRQNDLEVGFICRDGGDFIEELT